MINIDFAGELVRSSWNEDKMTQDKMQKRLYNVFKGLFIYLYTSWELFSDFIGTLKQEFYNHKHTFFQDHIPAEINPMFVIW